MMCSLSGKIKTIKLEELQKLEQLGQMEELRKSETNSKDIVFFSS